MIQKSYTILKKIGLEKYVNEFAKNLPYGAQRRLEIARALATAPFMLLLAACWPMKTSKKPTWEFRQTSTRFRPKNGSNGC